MKPISKIFSVYLLVILLILLANTSFGQITVKHFNAGWNEANGVDWIMDLKDCDTKGYVDISKDPDVQKEHKIAVVVGGWYSLMQEIQQAKEEPVPVDVTIIKEEILKEIPEAEISRMEFDMKDQMIRQTIITTQSDVEEIKKAIEKIEDKLYNR